MVDRADAVSEPGADHGCLPAWRVANLPEPLPPTFRNTLRTIGPGAILLAGAIGGGEWIVGPLMAVNYGPGILWIATIAIILQSLFNMEAVRYTLYTGEPILTGVMRLKPGPVVWAPFYLAIGAAQLATPAIAAGCAAVLYSALVGRVPADAATVQGAVDLRWMQWIGIGVILACVVILQSGKSIERVLERLSWTMIVFIFCFLTLANLLVVPADIWWSTLRGFVEFRPLPAEMDIVLLGLFAATAGSGGLGNLAISNWFRDKGFGMGAHVGGIGGALAQGHQELQPIGAVFPTTPENLRRWQRWWYYTRIDQQLLWGLGCAVGMFLNVNLARGIVPAEGVPESALGAFQAQYLAEHVWRGLWLLTLLNGFWILFSTHLGNTDCLVRTSADILWGASPRFQRWPASRIYACLLALVTCWALFAIHLGSVLKLFKVLGIVASPIMAIAAIQILRVNTRFLPPECRPVWWRKLALVLAAIGYGGISIALLLNLLS